MSEEEMNQELSTDDLKDVAGGSWTVEGNLCKTTGEGNPGNSLNKGNPQWQEICDAGTSVKGDLKTGDLLGKKGKYLDQGATCAD